MPTNPTRSILGCCCALAASGHAAAAPPSSVMNSRRFIRSPRRRALISLPEKAQPWRRTWHELRLLFVPVQGGKGAHPRQRRAEPVLSAWDEITALAQDSHPYHVGPLLPLSRRGRIDRRAAARTECLQAWIAALGRGLEVCRRLARYAKGRTRNGNIDAEGGAGADLAIRAVANRGLLGVRFAFDPDVAAVARAVDFHGSFLFLGQAQPLSPSAAPSHETTSARRRYLRSESLASIPRSGGAAGPFH